MVTEVVAKHVPQKAAHEDFYLVKKRIEGCRPRVQAIKAAGKVTPQEIEYIDGRMSLAQRYTESKNFKKADQFSKEAEEAVERAEKADR